MMQREGFVKRNKKSLTEGNKITTFFILIPCIVHLLLFCTKANKCAIISQIITLLHVSTLSCHPQGACKQYFDTSHKSFQSSYR